MALDAPHHVVREDAGDGGGPRLPRLERGPDPAAVVFLAHLPIIADGQTAVS
jgi:hypothetical protein